MHEISQLLWKAAAGLLLVAALLGALLLWQAPTSPALERLHAARAAFPRQELVLEDVTEPSMRGNLDHTDGVWPAGKGEDGTSRSDIKVVEGEANGPSSAAETDTDAADTAGE